MSYIKGSAEAVDTAEGYLSLEKYLEVGKKRAPNFNAEMRSKLYPIFEKYQCANCHISFGSRLGLAFQRVVLAPLGACYSWLYLM